MGKEEKKEDKRQLRCGICNVAVEDWDKHAKTEQHQKYINDPALIIRAMAESRANMFRAMIGARQVRVKPSDQIDKKNPDDLWNWHVAIRGSGGDVNELRENIMAICLYLLDKHGQADYRTSHVKGIIEKASFDIQDLEDVRYIIHAEAEGITHETDDVHGHWLKALKEKYEALNRRQA